MGSFTIASVEMEAVHYDPGNGSVTANDGKLKSLKYREFARRRSSRSLTGNIILGSKMLHLREIAYTKADTIKLKVSYDDQYGYRYNPMAVTSDRSARAARPGYTENYTIIKP